MSALSGIGRSAYYFFVEDGSIAIGTLIALVVVGYIGRAKPFGGADAIVGPLLFVIVAALLISNLLRLGQQARARR